MSKDGTTMDELQDTETQGDDLLEMAWVVIANATDWDSDNREEWRGAARRWRDAYFATLYRSGAVYRG